MRPKKAPQKPKMTPRRRLKPKSVSVLKKKLDTVYSQFIRLSAADHQGYATCYSCGVKKHWKELQCGHYVSRSFNSLRFDPRNTKPQCPGCNIFKSGNLDEYALQLIKEYGPDILQTLNREKRKIKQFSIPELENLIEEYTEKVKELGL